MSEMLFIKNVKYESSRRTHMSKVNVLNYNILTIFDLCLI